METGLDEIVDGGKVMWVNDVQEDTFLQLDWMIV
jgi:hypothetical protein